MAMQPREVGELVAAQGVMLDLAADALVTDVVVLAAAVHPDGRVSLTISTVERQSWITQLGMVQAAREIMVQEGWADVSEDEE